MRNVILRDLKKLRRIKKFVLMGLIDGLIICMRLKVGLKRIILLLLVRNFTKDFLFLETWTIIIPIIENYKVCLWCNYEAFKIKSLISMIYG